MRKVLILAMAILLVASVAGCNHYTRTSMSERRLWYQPQERDRLRYNSMENRWSYEKPSSSLRYNPFENRWEYAEPGGRLRYNPFENSWEYAR